MPERRLCTLLLGNHLFLKMSYKNLKEGFKGGKFDPDTNILFKMVTDFGSRLNGEWMFKAEEDILLGLRSEILHGNIAC